MKIDYIPLHYDRDWSWLQLVLPIPATDKTKGIIAVNVLEDFSTEPVAAALFDMWTITSVNVHWWMDTPLVIRHGFFHEIAKYVFQDCGKLLMTGIIPSSSTKSIKVAKHVGFEEVHRIKDGYDVGDDLVLLEGRLENADRWLAPMKTEEVAA